MIVIYGVKSNLEPLREQLSSALSICMHEELGFPLNKRSHRFVMLGENDMYFPEGRTEAYTLIEINMIEGRKKETIKRLIQALFASVEKNVGISNIDLEIIVKEQPDYCWGFRGLCGDEAKLNYNIKV